MGVVMKNTLAFPQPINPSEQGRGMTLRDYFAAKAMQGGIDLVPHMATPKVDKPVPQIIAEMAYEYADAMMKAREA